MNVEKNQKNARVGARGTCIKRDSLLTVFLDRCRARQVKAPGRLRTQPPTWINFGGFAICGFQ